MSRLRRSVFRALDRWVTAERRRQQRADQQAIEQRDTDLRAWSERAWQGHVHGNCITRCPFAHAERAGSSSGSTT